MQSSTARACLAVLGALVSAACGPAPYAISPDEAAAPEGPAPGVYVLVGPAQARLPAAPAAPPAPAEDRWIPDGFPRPNPFGEARTWIGEYDCPQGRTALTLRVIDVRGKLVRAVFDFHHAPSNTAGQFIVGGAYDEDSRQLALEPGPWIIHPDGYEPVALRGQVSLDGRRFMGGVAGPGCGVFRLRAAR